VPTLSWALNNACEKGHLSVVKELVEHTVLRGNIAVLGEALTLGSRRGQLNVVTWLVENAALHQCFKELGRALVVASRYAQLDVITWLLTNSKPDVNNVDYNGNSTIHHVIWHSVESDFNLLLHYTRIGDATEVCRLAFMCDADVNLQDNSFISDTPLHEACRSGYSDIVGALLLAGADETLANDRQETPAQELSTWKDATVQMLALLDVSSRWKMLVRSYRLRRQIAARVMLILVKCELAPSKN
jgi:ankyrin repeat protein